MAKTTRLAVFLYVPNIIGYLRILCCAASYYFAMDDPVTASILYLLGQGMDAIDGVAARALGQVSSFGAMLDMLTDRLGTVVLYMVISQLMPRLWGICAGLVVLDLVSHWCKMLTTVSSGKKTHKGSAYAALRFYYTFPYALFVFCAGNELFIMGVYLLAFTSAQALTTGLAICFPFFFLKQVFNVIQLIECCEELADADAANANAAAAAAASPTAAATAASIADAAEAVAAAEAEALAAIAALQAARARSPAHSSKAKAAETDGHGHSHGPGSAPCTMGHTHTFATVGEYAPDDHDGALEAFSRRFNARQ